MLHQSTYLQIDLGVNEAVSLRRTKGCELSCVRGRIWITEENGNEDIVLKAGESHCLTRPGRTVVQSLGQSEGAQWRLLLARPPRGALNLLWHWLPGAVATSGFRRVLGA